MYENVLVYVDKSDKNAFFCLPSPGLVDLLATAREWSSLHAGRLLHRMQMAYANHFYSTNQLLALRNKGCVCVPRQVRRRLFYYKINVRHIKVITSTQRLPSDHSKRTQNSSTLVTIKFRHSERKSSRVRPTFLFSNVCSIFNKLDEQSLTSTSC